MSMQALRWARTQMPRRGNKPYGVAKAVLMYLCDRADDKHQQCFPGQHRISLETGFGVTAIAEALDALEEQGYISRSLRRHQKGPRQGQRTSDLYTVLVSRPPDCLERGVEQPAALTMAVRRNRQPRMPTGPVVDVPRYQLEAVFGTQPVGEVLRPRMAKGWQPFQALPVNAEGRWEDFRDNGPGPFATRQAMYAQRQRDQEPPAWHYVYDLAEEDETDVQP